MDNYSILILVAVIWIGVFFGSYLALTDRKTFKVFHTH